MELAIDAGLIAVSDVNDWTTQVFGLGVLEPMRDVSPESLSLELIGTPVKAFGAASGALEGEVTALFYRYGTVGGTEYIADALIGPRADEPLATRPGDSGTLWVMDQGGPGGRRAHKIEPLAMQWGGHVIVTDGVRRESPYALVTFLSNVCRALDVEIVRDWNTGHNRYWGEVGHYTIGAKACELVTKSKLRKFFLANQANISFDLKTIEDDEYHTSSDPSDIELFYPLADVPDRVWKDRWHGIGRPHEGPNHFADMDQMDPNGDTLMSLWRNDPTTLTPQRWIAYYQSVHITQKSMGLLPFRVAQLYKLIVESLQSSKSDKVERALCAAGVMAHYVGDACQPLHVSQYHDGRPGDPKGVHSDYENRMVTSRRKKIITGLESRLKNAKPMPLVVGHREAGQAVVALMDRTIRRIDPAYLCQVWVDTEGHVAPMWDTLGTKTMDCIADGCKTLAMLWSSAWKESGATIPSAQPLDRQALNTLYRTEDFAPSLYLTEYAQRGIW